MDSQILRANFSQCKVAQNNLGSHRSVATSPKIWAPTMVLF